MWRLIRFASPVSITEDSKHIVFIFSIVHTWRMKKGWFNTEGKDINNSLSSLETQQACLAVSRLELEDLQKIVIECKLC